MDEQFDATVKLTVYQMIAGTGFVPAAFHVAQATNRPEPDVRAAFARLHAQRLLVPEPGDPSRIRMAPPFSGVPTAFPVEANGKRYFANCVWDAYGIAAALRADAVVPASDGHTGEALTLEVKSGRPVPKPYLAHFAVPAAHWWDDIVFT